MGRKREKGGRGITRADLYQRIQSPRGRYILNGGGGEGSGWQFFEWRERGIPPAGWGVFQPTKGAGAEIGETRYRRKTKPGGEGNIRKKKKRF